MKRICFSYILWMLSLSCWPLLAQQTCGSNGPWPIQEVSSTVIFPKSVLTIPVVFHVLYSTEEDSLSRAQLESQVEVLNADFRAENSDLADVIFVYRSRIADMEINFVLADQGADGTAAEGIVYRQVPPSLGETFRDGRRAICYDELGGSDAWCTQCYLNVWVVRNSLFAGKAVFPTEVGVGVPQAEDGIYINPDRVGTIGTVRPPYHLGRTLTHEVGHYLNLYHLWGPNPPDPNCDVATCCEGIYDDGIADTPEQWRTYLGECPQGPGATPSSCGGQPDNYQNFMTFAEDACLLMFTEGQKEWVRNSLATYRPGFLDADCRRQCISAVVTPETLPGKVWLGERVLWLEGIPKGTHLQWRSIQGQLLGTWINPGPARYQRRLPLAPPGLYVLTWQWQGGSGGQLLFKN